MNRDKKIADAIHEELDVDAQLIVKGLQEIQALNIENGNYFLASQLLAQGLERMMKVILFLSNNLQRDEMKQDGHNLNKWWRRTKALYHEASIDDRYLEKELKILSEFNKNGRYYYLDIMNGEVPIFNPQEEWERLEDTVIENTPNAYKKLSNGDDAKILINQINQCHIKSLEKIICALSKCIVRLNLNEVGWNVPLPFKAFAKYDDALLGTTDYSSWPNALVPIPLPRKITWKNRLYEIAKCVLFLQRDKSQIIYKSNYEGTWPFRDISEVRVIKHMASQGPFFLIEIKNELYALDGRSAALLNLPIPNKTGTAIVGVSIQPFLEKAKGL